jgi:endoglucanase
MAAGRSGHPADRKEEWMEIMARIRTAAALAALAVALGGCAGTQAGIGGRGGKGLEYGFTRAYGVVKPVNEFAGLNLGCYYKGLGESPWGPELDDFDFDRIRDSGFRSIRVSIQPLARMKREAGSYSLDPAFLADLDRVLGQTLGRDMIAVLSFHGLIPDGKRKFSSAEDAARTKEDFLAVWNILSARYRDYPESLHFELANEPHEPIGPELWNEYVGEARALIRSSGGNNSRRNIVVDVDNLIDPVTGRWDGVTAIDRLRIASPGEDPNMTVAFHYYDPIRFAFQGEAFTPSMGRQTRAWVGTTWEGTERQKAAVRRAFDRVAAWARENGRRAALGEFGASVNADIRSQATWTRFLREEAEARGMPWMLWQLFDGRSIGAAYNPLMGFWRGEILEALLPEGAGPAQGGAKKERGNSPEEVRSALRRLGDPEWTERLAAAQELRLAGSAALEAVPALASAVSDAEWGVRKAALLALADLGPEARAALPAVRLALADEEWQVRYPAVRAMGRLCEGSAADIGLLIGSLGDGEWQIRRLAILALEPWAKESPAAVAAVRLRLGDEEQLVSAQAALLLRALGDV